MSQVALSPVSKSSIVILAWCLITPLLSVQAEEAFPYAAQVSAKEATVYSGPGQEFYATDTLTPGSAVEVYRHDDNGWCAIRPPEGSFSWVSAEHLEITDNPVLARVINVPVKTRIGSNLGEEHDVEYISLRRGEIVELVGSQLLSDSTSNEPKRWFKIAPPSGEFRWVQSAFLHRQDGQLVHSKASTGTTKLEPMAIKTYELPASGSTSSKLTEVANVDLSATPKPDLADGIADTGFTVADNKVAQVNYEEPAEFSAGEVSSRDIFVAEEKSVAQAKVIDSLEAAMAPAENSTHVNVMTWEAVGSPTDPLAAPEPRGFVERYNALNVMLSRAILGDIETWKLDKLLTQTQLLASQAVTVEEQELAEGLADKVAEFQSLQQKSNDLTQGDSFVALTSGTDPASGPKPLPLPEIDAARLPSPARTSASFEGVSKPAAAEMPHRVRQAKRSAPGRKDLKKQETIDNSIFEASGTLVVVQSRRAGLPKYAITDNGGEIVKFLSTKDGSSLSHLVNKRVGVLGTQGFLRKLNRGHIVADRVVVLQR